MDNKQFPEQEENGIVPEEMDPRAVPVEPDEELPVIEELTFQEELPVMEEIPAMEILACARESGTEETLSAEIISGEEAASAQEEILPEEAFPKAETPVPEERPSEPEAPFEEKVEPEETAWLWNEEEPEAAAIESELPAEQQSVPETIPEEVPEAEQAVPSAKEVLEEAAEKLAHIEVRSEILPDTGAVDANGLLDHGEEEPAFDMDLLNDPDLRLPEEASDQAFQDNGKEFEDMLHAPEKKEKSAELPRQTHKGRPKRKKGEGLLGIPNIIVTLVWLALIAMIGVTAGRMLWVCAADVLAFGREDKQVTVTIYEADTMEEITEKLHEKGLIRYKSLFLLYADISDAREDIKAGIYDLNTRYDYHALVNFMSPRSSREVVTLTIPEGYTSRQIFSLLEENRICTAVDIAAYAAEGELNDYWFLEGVERGTETCLEGYLFPDTYEFYKNSTPREALQRMLNNFEIKFDEEMQAQIEALNAKFGCEYSVREITIVASLIEKESAAPDESPSIAGVIYNRLFNWGNTPAYLNIDASIVYALDGKADLTREDLQMDHPYNTYTNIGLTPGPISNPGLASMKAALNPESHNYYYYVLNPATGMHQFSTTNEEHNAYVRQFAEAE